ncbi:MAG: hypothetical protein QOI55_2833, partial [Actinomycetota bacterium]|nr:hypothetical protein [Actinomycetota bacterium]
MTEPFPGVVLCANVAPAGWLRGALRPWTDRGIRHVATLVPASYPAHARVFHRAATRANDVRWADIAAHTGQHLTAESRYRELTGWHPDAAHQSPPEPWLEPDRGSLRADECAAVAEVLARYTTTPRDCWFCLWEGYGTAWTALNRVAEHAPRVALEHRSCLLFRGPVSAATAFRSGPLFQSPTLWWPEDRAWCVASELDIYSTYVAATPPAVDALIEHPALEVLACSAEQDIDHGAYPTTT